MLRTSSDSYSRTHAVRVCRDRCAEEGFSGEAFHRCVELCVRELLGLPAG